MSVYGGDSWGREAQHRKRRVDDLMIEDIDSSVYKKLSSGKFACLVCPSNPVLDSPIMLSTHVGGSRHQAADLKRRNRELANREEIKKRLALADCVRAKAPANSATKELRPINKPLIEQARKAVLEVISSDVSRPAVKPVVPNLGMPRAGDDGSSSGLVGVEEMVKGVVGEVRPMNYRLLHERELKFTAAGWRRDGHGGWYKDENVEFDSDEEDPNVVLKETTS